MKGGGKVARTTRTQRFPAAALKLLLATRPFPHPVWKAATSESLCVRIANGPALSGQGASLDALGAFLQCTDAFACGFCEIWAVREAIYIETEAEYREDAGLLRRIPCAVVARTTHGLVQDLRFYLDLSSLSRCRNSRCIDEHSKKRPLPARVTPHAIGRDVTLDAREG